jgi:DNA polymerase IIIc chi subunit
MAPRLHLHELPGEKRAGELAKILETLYRSRKRVVVWVADPGRLKILDDYLWSYHKLAFLPHRVWQEGAAPDDEPILLVSEPKVLEGASVLVVGDELPPGDWAAGFEEVHDLVPPGEAGTERRAFWDRWRPEADGGGDGD